MNRLFIYKIFFTATLSLFSAFVHAAWLVYAISDGSYVSGANIISESGTIIGITNNDGAYEFLTRPNTPIRIEKQLADRTIVSDYFNVNPYREDKTIVQLKKKVKINGSINFTKNPWQNNNAPSYFIKRLGGSESPGWLYGLNGSDGKYTFSIDVPDGEYIILVDNSGPLQPKSYVKGFATQGNAETQVVINESNIYFKQFGDLEPPDPSKISISLIEFGKVAVEGSPGAVDGVTNVALLNTQTGNHMHLGSNPDGSFSAKFQAFKGDQIVVYQSKLHGYGRRHPVTGMAGTTVYVPLDNSESNLHSTIGSTSFGNDGSIMDNIEIYGAKEDVILHIEASIENLEIEPGKSYKMAGKIFAYKEHGFAEAPLVKDLVFGLNPVVNTNGIVSVGNPENSSTHMTVTGLPIEASPNLHNIGLKQFSVGKLNKISDTLYEGSIDFTFDISAEMPSGIYEAYFTPQRTYEKLTSNINDLTYYYDNAYSNSVGQDSGVRGHAGNIFIGEIKTSRIHSALFVHEFNNGDRGIVPNEDKKSFGIVGKVKTNSDHQILPGYDVELDAYREYTLEPFVPQLGSSTKGASYTTPIPLKFPSGSYSVKIKTPSGQVKDLGTEQFKSAYLHRGLHWDGNISASMNSPGEFYGLSTLSDKFKYEFRENGRHEVITEGYIEDQFGNIYSLGGTHEVWIGQVLELEPHVFPGTPFEVGNKFAAGLQIQPGLPASVSVVIDYYPYSDPSKKIQWSVKGFANRFGLFSPQKKPLVFEEPGEYKVNYFVQYSGDDNNYWYGSRSWGGVVITPNSSITTHGTRRNYNGVKRQWFFADQTPAGNKMHTPYQNGDISWMRHEYADPNNTGVKPELSLSDNNGELRDLVGDYWCVQGFGCDDEREIIIASRTNKKSGEYTVFSSFLLPEDETAQFAYAYVNNGKPGVAVREFLGEEFMQNAYWRFSDPYNYQYGQGTLGDEPKDIKFFFNSAVYRYPSKDFNYYGATGSLWVMLADDDELGARIMPPFQGASGGPSGGPILSLHGEEVDIFVHPMALKPGAIYVLGQQINFSGQFGPTLASKIELDITTPSGKVRTIKGVANKFGYFYDPDSAFLADEVGTYNVKVNVYHDGDTSSGKVEAPFPSGSILGLSNREYSFYVAENDDNDKLLDTTTNKLLDLKTGKLIFDLSSAGKSYQDLKYDLTISMPGFVIDQRISEEFPIEINLTDYLSDYTNIDFEEGGYLADTLSISIGATGTDKKGDKKYLGEKYSVLKSRTYESTKRNLFSNIIATDGTISNLVKITWSSIPGADSYEIARCSSIDIDSCILISEKLTSPSYEDDSGTVGTVYYYRVRACNDECSEWSSFDTGFVRAASLVPSIPQQSLSKIFRTDGKKTNSTISIGSSSDQGATYNTFFNISDEVVLTAKIYPDSNDVGEEGELYVVIRTLENGKKVFKALNEDGVWEVWNASLKSLPAAKYVASLESVEEIEIYSGTMTAGQRRIYVGYSLFTDGKPVITTSLSPLKIDVSD